MSKKTSTNPTKVPASKGRARAGKVAAAEPAGRWAPEANAVGPRGKIGAVVILLRRTQGATIPDLIEATGWQAHSVRGAIAGAIKKKLGLSVTSTKTETGRVYRIEAVGDAG